MHCRLKEIGSPVRQARGFPGSKDMFEQLGQIMKTTPAVLLFLCGSLVCGFAVQEPGANTRALRNSATNMAVIDLTDAQGSSNAHAARFTEAGDLIRPLGWRRVYVGTPLTPHDMNQDKAAFPEFHNVYVDPERFATFERTGE